MPKSQQRRGQATCALGQAVDSAQVAGHRCAGIVHCVKIDGSWTIGNSLLGAGEQQLDRHEPVIRR